MTGTETSTQKSSPHRVQLNMDPEVYESLQRYIKDHFGPSARSTTAVVQSFIIDRLKDLGYWDTKNAIRKEANETILASLPQ